MLQCIIKILNFESHIYPKSYQGKCKFQRSWLDKILWLYSDQGKNMKCYTWSLFPDLSDLSSKIV
jgi:hypothetical protein